MPNFDVVRMPAVALRDVTHLYTTPHADEANAYLAARYKLIGASEAASPDGGIWRNFTLAWFSQESPPKVDYWSKVFSKTEPGDL